MPTLVTDPDLEQDLIEKRKAWGGDKFDEVWDGVPLNWQLLSDRSGRLLKISHQQAAQQRWQPEIPQ